MLFNLLIALSFLVLLFGGLAYLFDFISKIERVTEEERERW